MKRAVWVLLSIGVLAGLGSAQEQTRARRVYNGPYTGPFLDRVAFPLGGLGAGMVCLEGTGALSHVSVRNRMEFFNEPCMFAAVCVKGERGNVARVLEGPIPDWKYFGGPMTGRGSKGTSYGLPRFREASFLARFPFGTVTLSDDSVPLQVQVTGWSPFLPGHADDSSLPAAALEYRFTNRTDRPLEAVFSYHCANFLALAPRRGNSILPLHSGFILHQDGNDTAPQEQADFAVFVDEPAAVVDHGWFRGAHYDAFTLVWNNIEEGLLLENPPLRGPSPGASLYVPVALEPGGQRTVRLLLAWYVPRTDLRIGRDAPNAQPAESAACCPSPNYVPWYACHFEDVGQVAAYWRDNYLRLRAQSRLFRDAFYDTTLPAEAIEAIAANLTILKSPTVLRQGDGRLWCFEGCSDDAGCCYGSCTHVWNYAQAIPHLFPALERGLRETEFNVSQDERGHQLFRTNLPIRPGDHAVGGPLTYGAADGQLGGIMKVHREWRISGDTEWLKSLWPRVRRSLDFSIETWDPRHRGALEEPHHNTYDIEYWGPDGHCTSFYLGALAAALEMGTALGDEVSSYRELLDRGKAYMEQKLYNGEYFFQLVQTEGLNAKFQPAAAASNGAGYRRYVQTINEEGPKYQYGTGCLSDGVLGFWIARMCGLDGNLVEQAKIRSHLTAVYQYNLRHDLSAHANPQRPSYALGNDGGLLLCTWPRGNKLTIPFIYSNEVWTGIEYQVASHLMLEGMVEKGLEIVRLCRDRYDGTRRNPFNEYECGHWYARALSSYGLLQGLTGVRYDAVDRTLHVRSQVGDDFRSFFAWDGGFGTVGLKKGKPFLDIKSGTIDIEKVVVTDETGAATSPWKTTPPSLEERRARAEQLQPRLMALRDQFEAHVFDAGAGESIPYRLFQPRETVPQAKYPLIIYLHGSVGRGSDNLKQISGGNLYGARIWALPEEQAQRPCFILAPQLMQGVGGQREMAAQGEKLGDEQDDAGLAGRWKQVTDSPAGELVMELTLHKQGPDYRGELRVPRQGTLAVEEVSYRNGTLTYKTVGPLPLRAEFLVAGRRFKGTLATFGEEERARRLLALIRSVVETRAIDKDRIYITGQSMGGGGTWGMIAFSPATFAAAVPVCGPCSVTTAPKIVEHGVAVWAFHGAADPTVPVRASRDMIEALRAAGGAPKYTEYPGVQHDSWVDAYTEPVLPEWLFEQKRRP